MNSALRLAAPALGALLCALALPAQRQHRSNPFFGQVHPFGFVNGEPPDTSNWPHPAAPDHNPFPRSTAAATALAYRENKRQLGKLVFWDEQLSTNNTMACGTCHATEAGGTDARPGPGAGGTGGNLGVIRQHMAGGQMRFGYLGLTAQTPPSPNIQRQATPLAAPTMIGNYVFNLQFWDGRSGPALDDGGGGVFGGGIQGTPGPFSDWAAIEDQAHEPQRSPVEMGHEALQWPLGVLQSKLDAARPLALVNPTTIPADVLPMVQSGRTYRQLFDDVFGLDTDAAIGGKRGVTRERVAMAIATYERTLIPDGAPIDVPNKLTIAQLQGFQRMKNTGCFQCHSASGNPTLTAQRVLADAFDNAFSDGDLHDISVVPGDGPKKTPTLRNIGLHKRFFSVGTITSREALLDFYNARPAPLGFAGAIPANSVARAQVRDFLFVALTDPRVASRAFPFDRPELASERAEFAFESNEFGVATPGPSGTPEILANEPPLVPTHSTAQHWFKVGVGNAAANSAAVLWWSNAAGVGPGRWIGPIAFPVAAGNTSPQGIATANVPFPLTAATIGTPVFTQWTVLDFGFQSASDAARFTPFAW